MNDLTEYEAALIIQNLEFADRPLWEMTRLKMYASVVAYSKKKIQPTDILKFSWEQPEQLTDEDFESIEKQRIEFEQLIKNITMNNTNGS